MKNVTRPRIENESRLRLFRLSEELDSYPQHVCELALFLLEVQLRRAKQNICADAYEDIGLDLFSVCDEDDTLNFLRKYQLI